MNARGKAQECDVLILPDGEVLAHNLTRELAAILSELNPFDQTMARRANGEPKCRADGTGNTAAIAESSRNRS